MSRLAWLPMVVVAMTGASAPRLYAADAPPQTDHPCGPLLAHVATLPPDGVVTPDIYAGEGLTDYLQRDDKEPRATLAVVSPACREEVRRGRAGPASELVREALARQPGWANVGRIVACATQDPAYLSAVPEWLADERHAEARAACFATLATWPGAEPIRPLAYAHVVRKDERGWYVDRALLSVLRHPNAWSRGARDDLAPALRAAAERRAVGFDTLRAAICADVDNERLSSERARVCAEAGRTSEARWREEQGRTQRWAIRLGATVPYAGAVALAYAGRDSDLGLAVATGAGALAGASLGILLGAWAALADADEDLVEVGMLLGTVALGTLGGFAAHAAVEDSPSWRAPVTAGALLVPLTIVWGSAHAW